MQRFIIPSMVAIILGVVLAGCAKKTEKAPVDVPAAYDQRVPYSKGPTSPPYIGQPTLPPPQ